jgi:hypothetical protein
MVVAIAFWGLVGVCSAAVSLPCRHEAGALALGPLALDEDVGAALAEVLGVFVAASGAGIDVAEQG